MRFREACEITSETLSTFAQKARNRQTHVIHQKSMATIAKELDVDEIIQNGGLTRETLRSFLNSYLSNATVLYHPRFMAHQVAIPQELAPIGSLVDGFLNNPMAIYEMGPAAATIEHALINWLVRKVGWNPPPLPGSAETRNSEHSQFADGVLTHGGSLANLTGLAAARAKAVPNSWNEGIPSNLVMIAPANSHYSNARAAGILGIGQNNVISAPVDENGLIIPKELDALIKRLQTDGKLIMSVTANACSTAAGLYDDLLAIGSICRKHDIWLHVDGAHGASALISQKYKHLLAGIELADSLSWDAHKMMRTPTLCAAVLMRDHHHLNISFQEEASYLFHDKEEPALDYIHRTVECTKAALGVKLFFALAQEGEKGLEAFIDKQTDFAHTTANYIQSLPDFEVAIQPQTNIVCFRMKGISDEEQLKLRTRLTHQGDCYISSTEFKGKRWLRLTLMNPDTNMSDIEYMINALRALK